MSMPTLPRDFARWRSLHILVNIVADAYDAATDAIVDAHFGGDVDAFQAAMRDGLNHAPAPNTDNMRELLELISLTSINAFDLGYEDRDFLARVRSHLLDALSACVSGDLEALASATHTAYMTLDFITYRRKRTDKRDYHNPFANEKQRFEDLTARTSRLARSFDKVVVSA